MHTIRTVNTQRFSLNGIEYLKNYVTNISGQLLEIFNCYDRQDVLLTATHVNQFVVNGATYNTAAQLQAALADILYVRTTLGEVAADISQNNIDVVRKLRIPTFSITNVLNAINTGPAFTISDTQSVWFVITITAGSTAIPRGSVYKYKMTGLGKGDYGASNGTNSPVNLALGNLELVYFNAPTASGIRLEPTTTVINFGVLAQDGTLFNWLNSRPANAPISIQPAEEGLTIFEGTINGTATQRLWNGGSGKYGIGAQQAQDFDFQTLNEGLQDYEVPDYEMVLSTGPKSTQYALHQEAGQENITGYGNRIYHSGIDGKISVEFENPVADVVYTIPARIQNETFGMLSDIHKPIKLIATGDERISGGIYNLEPEDFNYWLSFEMVDDFTVMIPKIFYAGMLVEGDVSSTGMAIFQAEEVYLRHGSSELPRTAERNSVFGIKFRKDDEALLFGKLELK